MNFTKTLTYQCIFFLPLFKFVIWSRKIHSTHKVVVVWDNLGSVDSLSLPLPLNFHSSFDNIWVWSVILWFWVRSIQTSINPIRYFRRSMNCTEEEDIFSVLPPQSNHSYQVSQATWPLRCNRTDLRSFEGYPCRGLAVPAPRIPLPLASWIVLGWCKSCPCTGDGQFHTDLSRAP